MHPQRKQRLILVLFIVVFASIAVGLAVFALRENINFFYPPSKLANGEAPVDVHIRAGGCVVPGSVKRNQQDLRVSFDITDGAGVVRVEFEGILPDLFDEGESAVAAGRLDADGVFQASEVLAKHDEEYTPPEVAEAVGNVNEHAKTCEGMSYGA